MKASSVVLFILRLILYFSVIILIYIHPGITINFDRIGVAQWIIFIPIMSVIAFIPENKINIRSKCAISIALLFALSLFAGATAPVFFQLFAAGLASYALTFLLFNRILMFERIAKLAAIEPFFLAWVCLRLLALSRSGEDIAGQAMILTQFILAWTAVVFLLHSIIIYLCLFPNSRARTWKEGLVFFIGASAVLVMLLVVFPPDFVKNAIIENLVTERIPQIIRPSERGIPSRGDGGGRRTLPRGEGNENGQLRGILESEWMNRGSSSGESRQYMVKIVASEREPVYMGEAIRGRLDPVYGFQLSTAEQFNELIRQRLFVTWSDNERNFDLGRQRQEVFSLSIKQQKFLPYRPVLVDPIILNEDSGPLRYIHQVVSNTHLGDPLTLIHKPVRQLTNREKSALSHYLEINIEDSDREVFETYLKNALETWQNYHELYILSDPYLDYIFSEDHKEDGEDRKNEFLEIIIAILVSFSQYQYNLNQSTESSIEAMKYFLFESFEGDCVEFSNTLALLGRLAGIPSRVVTGYLAAESLQTRAHYRGIASLREQIPILQNFPFQNLYMVTNIHGHSWTQFYIPEYGWLDFESTSFSIPPLGMGDFNNWDVVIPILDQNRTISQVRKFPWRAAGRAVIILIISAIIGAYAIRYGREIILFVNVRSNASCRSRARSLYLLLLSHLAADGQPIKPASKTAHEYSKLFPDDNACFKNFANIYSELRWRVFTDETAADERMQSLWQEYNNILSSTRRRGLHHAIKRILSLRGLAYL